MCDLHRCLRSKPSYLYFSIVNARTVITTSLISIAMDRDSQQCDRSEPSYDAPNPFDHGLNTSQSNLTYDNHHRSVTPQRHSLAPTNSSDGQAPFHSNDLQYPSFRTIPSVLGSSNETLGLRPTSTPQDWNPWRDHMFSATPSQGPLKPLVADRTNYPTQHSTMPRLTSAFVPQTQGCPTPSLAWIPGPGQGMATHHPEPAAPQHTNQSIFNTHHSHSSQTLSTTNSNWPSANGHPLNTYPRPGNQQQINGSQLHSVVQATNETRFSSSIGMPTRNTRNRRQQNGTVQQTRTRKKPIKKQERKHQCGVCSKWFTRPVNVRTHMLVHTGQKPFPCKYCGKEFGTASNRTRHEKNTHQKIQGGGGNLLPPEEVVTDDLTQSSSGTEIHIPSSQDLSQPEGFSEHRGLSSGGSTHLRPGQSYGPYRH
jgi:hypothetical protein